MTEWVRWLDDVTLDDLAEVGGKNAGLGELRRHLVPLGVAVPGGFAVTAAAYRAFLEAHRLPRWIDAALAGLDVGNVPELERVATEVRNAITSEPLPADLAEAVRQAYARLQAEHGRDCAVAVRSSATAEDLPEASFAGQQETYLGVTGAEALLDAVRRCMASLFTERAIVYRAQHGFDHRKVALSVGIQPMIRSDLACAGVAFTLDTETGFPDVVLINSAWGLGESVVKGVVTPDEFMVFKTTLLEGFRPILKRSVGGKETRLVYGSNGQTLQRQPVPAEERRRATLMDDEILQLARWSILIERHFSARNGKPTPMDLEWAKDGTTGKLYVVQARPETVESQKRKQVVLERHHLDEVGEVLATGKAVGMRIGQGRARLVRSVHELERVQPGDVLVAEMTDPDWEPGLAKAAAVVTDKGGRTCHAAIVSRELGIPAVVGTGNGTARIADGQEITVSCAEGEDGHVYRGRLKVHVERTEVGGMGRPRTRVLMNLGNPAEALGLSQIPNDGVGLARLEFIISNHIGIHPMALLHPTQVEPAAREEIARRTQGYDDPAHYFVDKLAEGVGMLAAAFYPKDVLVRLSDFKTNEYASLLGGRAFEPQEANPMLGFRGASRYYDPRYRDGFALECQALRQVREDMGLTNVQVMVPFCRTPEEGRRVVAEMARHGLVQHLDGLEVWVMCEIPSNVVLADRFAEVFDGFSIGSNDLTQLVLGVDRDSALVARLFDERDEAVLRLIAQVIATVHAAGRKIGICGQAPSDYPEFTRFLVEHGIDSLSLNPDAVLETTLAVLALEQQEPPRTVTTPLAAVPR